LTKKAETLKTARQTEEHAARQSRLFLLYIPFFPGNNLKTIITHRLEGNKGHTRLTRTGEARGKKGNRAHLKRTRPKTETSTGPGTRTDMVGKGDVESEWR